jgi:UDP-N-acetylmuramate--alanine ligase
VQALIARLPDRKIVTYGMNPQAEVRAVNMRSEAGLSRFDAVIASRGASRPRTLANLELPMAGVHNVQNTLAAIAIANEMGIADDVVRRALAKFAGVKRRFTKTGEANGVTVIDDYGHHPVEIKAVLAAARASTKGKVIAVVQPHRYTRLRDLFEEFCTAFNAADAVIVADVYAAGEAPIPGIGRDALVAGLTSHGHRNVTALQRPEQLAALVAGTAVPGDLVVCLGAGSITNWANALPNELRALGSGAAGTRGAR